MVTIYVLEAYLTISFEHLVLKSVKNPRFALFYDVTKIKISGTNWW